MEILNGLVYISSENKHFSYSGELSDVRNIFDGAKIFCYDGKALYHSLKRGGIDPESISFIDLMLYAYVLNPGGGSPTAETLATSFIGKTPEANSPTESLFVDIEKAMREKIFEIGVKRSRLVRKPLFFLHVNAINHYFSSLAASALLPISLRQ